MISVNLSPSYLFSSARGFFVLIQEPIANTLPAGSRPLRPGLHKLEAEVRIATSVDRAAGNSFSTHTLGKSHPQVSVPARSAFVPLSRACRLQIPLTRLASCAEYATAFSREAKKAAWQLPLFPICAVIKCRFSPLAGDQKGMSSQEFNRHPDCLLQEEARAVQQKGGPDQTGSPYLCQ